MRFSAARVRRAAVATALVASSVLGLSVMAAAPASAKTTRGCSTEWAYSKAKKTTTSVRLRSYKSTSSTVLGVLPKGTRFREYCIGSGTPNKYSWGWGKVTSGPNAGRWGWVYGENMTWV
ncbi:hypothetical protein ACWCOW_40445 [Streptomyces sp. NPDC001939]